MVLAFLAGIGGGAFSGFMPSTSYFFPRSKQGTALGLQAGLLLPGYPADVTILSVSEETVIQKDHMRSRSHNTPFDGWHVRGRVQTTIVEGEARYEYEKIG